MTPEQNLRVKSLVDRSDVFNYVIDHLRSQGGRSMIDPKFTKNNDVTFCAYRGIDQSEGTKETMCAVGALITDDEYDPAWEGSSIEDLFNFHNLPTDLYTRLAAHREMLDDLQCFHDMQITYTEEGVFTQYSEAIVAALRKQWNIQ